jgi:hypothetical protein
MLGAGKCYERMNVGSDLAEAYRGLALSASATKSKVLRHLNPSSDSRKPPSFRI